MNAGREVTEQVKQHRREALNAGMAAYDAAMDAGDEAGAERELETMKALDLVVTTDNGMLVTGPDVAD